MSAENSNEVRLSRPVFGLLVLACVAGLSGMAYLLGKENGRGEVTVAPMATPTFQVVVAAPPPVPVARSTPEIAVVVPPPSHPAAAPRATVTELPGAPAMAAPSPDAPPRPVSVPATKRVANAPAVKHTSAEAAAVRAYLQAVDRIAPEKLGDDPDKMANEIVNGALNGNMTGMNKLVAEAEETEQKMHALHPPPACEQFHQDSLKVSTQGVSLLKRMSTSLAKGDSGALTSLAGEAQAMQSEAQNLKDEETALKQQWGIN